MSKEKAIRTRRILVARVMEGIGLQDDEFMRTMRVIHKLQRRIEK